MAPPTSNPFSPISRLITTHNDKGEAIFSTKLPEETPVQHLPSGDATFQLAYCTEVFPVQMNEGKDIASYEKYLHQPPGLVVSTGSVLRCVDIPPKMTSPMHRTVSLDYGIVLEGTVLLVLDSGEEKVMKRGSVAIQRGTNHAWRNDSETEWARMMFVLLPAQPLLVGGRTLGEDLSDMQGVREST